MPENRPDPTRPEQVPYPAPHQAPATGASDPVATEMKEQPVPDLRGTILFTILLLMAIFGFWVLMFIELLNR
jgi:hypothetical protein